MLLRPHVPRRGVTLVEVMASAVVLAAAVGLTLQTLSSVAGLRRSAEQRQYALGEAQNILERIEAQGEEPLSEEQAAAWQLSEEARRALPDGELKLTVTPTADPPAGQWIRVEIRWRGPRGEMESPVRLSTWVGQGAASDQATD